MDYIKLDAKIMLPIGEALKGNCTTVALSTSSAVKFVISQHGWVNTTLKLMKCFVERPVGINYELADKNVQRKLIRFPALRYFGPIAFLYRRYKKLQCMLFSYVIENSWDNNPAAIALIFNGTMMPESILANYAKATNRSCLFVENGYFPDTLQIDALGINANNSLPSNPDFYLSYTPQPDQLVPTSIGIRVAKVKYENQDPLPESYIFVPFQVPSDMQVTELSPWIKDMESFYDVLLKVVEANPDINFVIKEHPSFRRSIIGKVPEHSQIRFANGFPTPELIATSDAVVTLNSTVGIEALVLSKKVITLGLSSYNIDGLIMHCASFVEFGDALRNIEAWEPNEELRQHFLQYLYHEYLVPGSFQKPSPNLSEYIEKRVG